ncbi:MAG: TRAP transporter substrate-binding protein DctP [Candidatus Methanomethylicaceae archaeon]
MACRTKSILAACASFVCFVMFCPSTLWSQTKIKLKLAGAFPPPEVSMMSEAVQKWESLVTEKTAGSISFENYWGASLGSPAEHIDLVKNGTVQLGNFHQWYTPSRMPLGDFEYAIPFGPVDYELVTVAMRKIRQEFPQFTKELDDNNLVLIADLPFGVYNFMSRVPLKTIEDFKGKKVSLIGRYFGKWLPPGATPVVRPGHERYDLLRTGVVDVDLLPFDLLYAFKIHEVTKYYVQVDLMTACGAVIVMNKDAFASLPREWQKVLLDLGREVEMWTARELIYKWHEICKSAWEKAGLTFIKFPPEERVKWANSIPDTAKEWAEDVERQGLPGSDIVKRWQEITTELGYKWPRIWGK